MKNIFLAVFWEAIKISMQKRWTHFQSQRRERRCFVLDVENIIEFGEGRGDFLMTTGGILMEKG